MSWPRRTFSGASLAFMEGSNGSFGTIEARSVIDRVDRQTEGLAKAPANTISDNRAPQRSGGRDRDANLEESVRSRAEREEAML